MAVALVWTSRLKMEEEWEAKVGKNDVGFIKDDFNYIVRVIKNGMYSFAATERWFGFSRYRKDWWTNRRPADKQKDRQLERGDDLTMQREIVKWLMEERAQSHRHIIRQAANAELLAKDHTQTRSTAIYHVWLRKQMLSCLPFIQPCLTACPIPATCCCVCVFLHLCVSGVYVFFHFTLPPCCQSMIRLCLFNGNALVLMIWAELQNVCTHTL